MKKQPSYKNTILNPNKQANVLMSPDSTDPMNSIIGFLTAIGIVIICNSYCLLAESISLPGF